MKNSKISDDVRLKAKQMFESAQVNDQQEIIQSSNEGEVLCIQDIPEFQEIIEMEKASKSLGIANPFFRSHDAKAGAVTIIDGKEYINFASYDYLGLNCDERVMKAAIAAIEQYGVSASASRVVAGERTIHQELEDSLASFLAAEAAVVFISGYLTNITVIDTLLDKEDLVIYDEYSHNSIVKGATISGAKGLSFRHNDLAALRKLLKLHRKNYRRCLIVIEGLYSMDGDTVNLPEFVAIKKEFNAWLMVDEAHSIGSVGKTGRGIREKYELECNCVDVWMGTLSKTFGSTGGYVAGSAELIKLLKSKAAGFVFSVGLSPPLAGAAIKALEIMDSEPERVAKLQENGKAFLKIATSLGLDTGFSEGYCVSPLLIGNSIRAAKLSENLFMLGFNVLPIIYPAVPMNSARLRFFLTSEHTQEQIEKALVSTSKELNLLKEEGFGEGLFSL